MTAIDIFIAYSHKDLAFKAELRVHLRPLVRSGRAQVWDDYDIEAGSEWDAAIKEKLFGAQIILLLVSPDSLDSDYFYGKEVTVSLDRHARGEATVVPVILRSCLWQQTPLGALEALPTKGRPVASWPSRDDAWHAVAQEVSELIDSRQADLDKQSAQEKQRREFAAAAEAADLLFQKENWAEAAKAYADALGLNQPGFLPEATVLRERMTHCKLQTRPVAERQRQEAQAARPAAHSSSNTRLWIILGTAVLCMCLALLLWPRITTGDSKKETITNTPTTTQPGLRPDNDAETADFTTAKSSGKIKTLEQFLAQYPDGKHKAEAARILVPLYWTAANNVRDDDPNVACAYLQKLLALDPTYEKAQNMKRELKCH